MTCEAGRKPQRVLAAAPQILMALGVTLNVEKTRIVHVRHGFEFLGL